ncbi:MAG TPA: aminopeptidase [Polyangiaceae bacterium]|nr:aminopeptidase [Polyangiaceae bacterium]
MDSKNWDAVVVVTPTLNLTDLTAVYGPIRAAAEVDERVGKEVTMVHTKQVAGGRLVIAPTGPIQRDWDDVRRYGDAAKAGVRRARDAGARRPLLLVPRVPVDGPYDHALEVSLLGALEGLWEPLEARQVRGEQELEPMTHLGFAASTGAQGARIIETVSAIETGRRLARDLAGTEPERMTPMAFAEHCRDAFAHTAVKVQLIDNNDEIQNSYPLLAAVARASSAVPRHRPCVLRLCYEGAGDIRETLLLAGKGVTYDTGGMDLKVGGNMAGMSPDKGGAATVAGFIRTLAALAPAGRRVVAELGLVRNSIGANAYVSDEILTSHAGVRVRVGNTDAEGRLVLADLLSHLRHRALEARAPILLSVATLTGHAARAVGPYTVAIENGPARKLRLAAGLASLGDQWADPVELSRLRREDFDFIRPRTKADDVLQCNNAPSSATERGHQFPAAFLLRASGLEQHGGDSRTPLPFVHLDLGGSACEGGDWQHGHPTAAMVTNLSARWAMDR